MRHDTSLCSCQVSQLAVDTHGYTDFAMSHARLLGFDLCPLCHVTCPFAWF
ncbi:Tn3 family transposase [Pseudomonas sp. BYT-1]|uniref:Tn3 family transposase n=1 Tax=Pseudomonas sp. BYT-1 TaxID=2816906 RepID=UPI0024E200EA|nr:Tn3 family transposase [Pseudomonas sp. BYT-1]